jgi:hypothetical protein
MVHIYMENYARALDLALEAHAGQNDKGGKPYIGHPLRVASRFFAHPHLATIALLHDVVEDSDITLDQLRAQFGDPITDAVDRLTRRAGESYEDYVLRAGSDPGTRWIKMSDLLDNLDVRRLTPGGTLKDLQRLAKYRVALETLYGLCKRELEYNAFPFREEVEAALATRMGAADVNLGEEERECPSAS